MQIDRLNPHTRSFSDNPYPAYARYRQHDPIHWGLPQVPTDEGCWYLFRYADVAALLKDKRFRRKWPLARKARELPEKHRPFIELADRFLLSADPPRHQQLRAIIGSAFSPSETASRRAAIQAMTDRQFDRLEDKDLVDLVKDLATPLSLNVIRSVLGLPDEDEADLLDWSAAIGDGINLRTGAENIERASVAALSLRDYFATKFDERRKHPRDDLLTHLLDASHSADEPLDELDLVAQCEILFAGHETSASLLASGMLSLLQHEDQLALLQRGFAHVPQAVNEMLRYNGPVQTAAVRRPVEDVVIGGIRIAEGQPVIAFIGAANRDPAVFAEPDRFDILRTGERSIAFGTGLHACIGMSLARLECEVALGTLLRRWPGIRLAGGTLLPRWRHHVVLRGLEQLPVHKA